MCVDARVRAALEDSPPLLELQFFVAGSPVGSAQVVNGVATLPLTINSASGTYNVTAQFTSTNPYYVNSAGGPAVLTVNKENTATAYTGDTAILTGGPDFSTATVRLGAHLTAEADGNGFTGDITKAAVSFELFKSTNLSGVPNQVINGVAVNATGDALTTVNNLPAGTYSVKVKVEAANLYWTANPVGAGALSIVVASKDTQSQGEGWVSDPASSTGRATFEFSVKPDKKLKDGPVKGNWTLSFRGSDGYDYIVESTGWQGGYLQFSAEPGVTPTVYTRSNFKGQCSVRKVNPATHQTVATLSNYSFEVFAKDGDLLSEQDNNEEGQQADTYAFTVWDGNGQFWHGVGSRTTMVTLGGGEVENKIK